jgi:hypothetical protein
MFKNTPGRRLKKKHAAIALTAALVLGGGGAAFAYWTTTGTGTGSGAAGSNAPISIVQTSTVSNLRPGGAAQTLSGNFTNLNDSPTYVASVTASIASVTKASGAAAGTCDATDFILASPTMVVNASVPSGVAQGAWTGATVTFNNKAAVNQDACKSATIAFSYTSN